MKSSVCGQQFLHTKTRENNFKRKLLREVVNIFLNKNILTLYFCLFDVRIIFIIVVTYYKSTQCSN